MWFKIKNNIHTIIIIIVTIAIGLLLLDLSNNDDSAIIIRTQRYNNYIGDVIGENGTYILKTNDKGKIIYNHPKAYNYLVGYSTIDHGSSGLLKLYEQALYDAPRGYNKGATMTTTINTKLQNDCYSLLNGLEGSIVVLERNTGKVKAIVSCSGNDFNINDLYEDFDSVIFKDNLVDRATQTQEAPGSTFKSVITALAIENNQDTYIFNDVDGSVKFDDGSTIHNYHGYSYGKTNLAKALNKSSNVYFSSLAVALKKDNINSLEKIIIKSKNQIRFYHFRFYF